MKVTKIELEKNLTTTRQIQNKIKQYFDTQLTSLENLQIPNSLYQNQIGPHLRHSHDFIDNFLTNYNTTQNINYEKRDRESKISKLIETNKDKGIQILKQTINKLTQTNLEQIILQTTTDFGTTQSNTNNELTTIASHTMHHLGIIGETLTNNKIKLPKYFGYAPSTINYQNITK